MSDWYWKVIALKAAFILTCFSSYIRSDDNIKRIPFCNPHNVENGVPVITDLVIVSTLDGRLTAFSTNDGTKAWDLQTQPLLSSNLHHVELTSGGKWVRLVPSLRGGLYSLSGETIEPLPFDAEQLLSSSFKYSDDLVIAGARETLWLGVDASTGGVVYECGSSGCNSEQQRAGAGIDVLVLRRHSSTLRALDPRNGHEKWNFSVAEHQLALSRRECMGPSGPASPVTVGVALPEGVVAIRRPGDADVLWRQKLEAPVASVWRLQGGSLQSVDVVWEAARALASPGVTTSPSLYIGLHNDQLYVQESLTYTQKLETAVSSRPLPWKMLHSRPLINGDEKGLSIQEPDPNSLSLMTLYGNTRQMGSHGFFLYLQETCDQAVQVSEDTNIPDIILPNSSDEEFDHHIHVHVSSLWYWWKEVLVIVASSVLLFNLIVWPKLFPSKDRPSTTLPVVEPPPPYQPPVVTNTPEFSSRYETDFTPLRCLGRGGFGVVFEARNNIDHRDYAIKRITLPRKEEKRQRVYREVRALAKLEHEHIVRYFNSWIEVPPPQWQRERDRQWFSEMDDVLRSSSCSDSFSIVFDENLSKKAELTISSEIPKKHSLHSSDPNASFRKQSSADNGCSIDKRLERVKGCEQISQSSPTESSPTPTKKKKGHKRHWSLDMCVGGGPGGEAVPDTYLYIQMQLCQRDSLHDWLRNNRTAETRGNIAILFRQIVSAVEYVHLDGLIHRDLKPSNIFFAPDGKVKIGDFGLVTDMSDNSQDGEAPPFDAHTKHTHQVGTRLYMSPEQVQGLPYNYKVDIYSLGVILFELLQPFGTDSERVHCLQMLREHKFMPTFQHKYPQETEVLKLMLSADPSKRPTAMGVRARAPLRDHTDSRYHFTLPPGPAVLA
ncbi:eukaryotic translation initiation factor 2-alpha kinase [Achroia grisella]|uniref:eukaryotic translation initiation factor 2-alpha kinase n=1 Tax=Achroia grisella TaxID=688607 RepID=UPI0027D26353|nr:eukaryotic translation initiation factor 2-alpha kinase [Achroia grisella]